MQYRGPEVRRIATELHDNNAYIEDEFRRMRDSRIKTRNVEQEISVFNTAITRQVLHSVH